jgi:hypothetical protein
LVYGIPQRRRQVWWRRVGAGTLLPVLRWLTQLRQPVSGFRLMTAALASEVAGVSRPDVVADFHLVGCARKTACVRVTHAPTRRRRSTYSLPRLAVFVVRIVAGYAPPAKRWLAAVAGLLTLAAGMVVATSVLRAARSCEPAAKCLLTGLGVLGLVGVVGTAALWVGALISLARLKAGPQYVVAERMPPQVGARE